MTSNYTSPAFLESVMPLLALVLVVISYLLHRWKQTPSGMTLQETAANLVLFTIWRFIFFSAGLALQLVIFSYLASLVPWKLPNNPSVFIAAVFVADFCYYWKHRMEHDLSVLWAEHSVHHSSGEFNLSTSLRLPWFGSYLNWPFFLIAIPLGFSGEQIILGHQVVLAYQYLVHTEFVGRLGVFERLLNTPSHHRVHHGRNPEYLDKNYGGIFIWWDKLFGTFQSETVAPLYGTVHPIGSQNPLAITFRPWAGLWATMLKRPTWRGRVAVLFTAPRDLV
ncbi:MAG: sterol desaturase family protein [Bdellovibrionota bacterium]